MTALQILKGIHEEEVGGMYMAGTLSSNGFAFHPECYEPVEGMFSRPDNEKQEYSKEEAYWWAKCYVKYKTSNHAFYEQSQKVIAEYEGA